MDEKITQDQFFAEVGINSAMKVWDGYNVTFLAYGQTGSGKTHTMYGPGLGPSVISQNTDARGFVARIVECLFNLRSGDAVQGKLAKFSLSFIDIYEERVFDLFDPGNEKKVRESSSGVYVEGAVWKPLVSVEQSLLLCEEAIRSRKVSETKMNARSSRSHTLCMIKVCRDLDKLSDGVQSVRSTTAVMTLVDLCGSERVKKSDVEGSRLREAININSSLSVLKSVIAALGDGAAHVPYRESRLTWLLKDRLGANGVVYLVAHLNPHEDHHVETVSTLRFVSFASTVRGRALRNERVRSRDELLAEEAPPPPPCTPPPDEEPARPAAGHDKGTQVSPPKPARSPHGLPPDAEGVYRCGRGRLFVIEGPDMRRAPRPPHGTGTQTPPLPLRVSACPCRPPGPAPPPDQP